MGDPAHFPYTLDFEDNAAWAACAADHRPNRSTRYEMRNAWKRSISETIR